MTSYKSFIKHIDSPLRILRDMTPILYKICQRQAGMFSHDGCLKQKQTYCSHLSNSKSKTFNHDQTTTYRILQVIMEERLILVNELTVNITVKINL